MSMNSKGSDFEYAGPERAKGENARTDGSILIRLTRIEEALRREHWLPIGLRSLLATELPLVRKSVLERGRSWRKRVASQVLALALASWLYDPSLMRSETVSQLRVLDLELSPEVGDPPDGDEFEFLAQQIRNPKVCDQFEGMPHRLEPPRPLPG